MNYDKARQMKDGTWNYSRQNDDLVYPIGYCSTHENHESYHRHPTQQEAEACYKKYQLDNYLKLEETIDGALLPCEICETWTNKMAVVGGWHRYKLCNEHRNRETVETLYDTSGTCMHS